MRKEFNAAFQIFLTHKMTKHIFAQGKNLFKYFDIHWFRIEKKKTIYTLTVSFRKELILLICSEHIRQLLATLRVVFISHSESGLYYSIMTILLFIIP
jgi:hypothetical protein